MKYRTGTPDERFWPQVDAAGDCWEWTGGTNTRGYGNFSVKGRGINAHRYAWETLVGPVPAGLVLDHQCRNRRCVNPDHLRIVSHRENIRSGHSPTARIARSNTCRRGHPFTPENTIRHADGTRQCRACHRDATRRSYHRVKERAA